MALHRHLRWHLHVHLHLNLHWHWHRHLHLRLRLHLHLHLHVRWHLLWHRRLHLHLQRLQGWLIRVIVAYTVRALMYVMYSLIFKFIFKHRPRSNQRTPANVTRHCRNACMGVATRSKRRTLCACMLECTASPAPCRCCTKSPASPPAEENTRDNGQGTEGQPQVPSTPPASSRAKVPTWLV